MRQPLGVTRGLRGALERDVVHGGGMEERKDRPSSSGPANPHRPHHCPARGIKATESLSHLRSSRIKDTSAGLLCSISTVILQQTKKTEEAQSGDPSVRNQDVCHVRLPRTGASTLSSPLLSFDDFREYLAPTRIYAPTKFRALSRSAARETG